jgi:LysR family glycine cleavage system transcriptional activator
MPILIVVVRRHGEAWRARRRAFAREPLLGDSDLWKDWFADAGLGTNVRTVADFNDAGLMLQAAEQSLGLALSRELLAADALADGRLVRLSPLAITVEPTLAYHLVYPPNLREWPPLTLLREWLHDELELSRQALHPPASATQQGALTP